MRDRDWLGVLCSVLGCDARVAGAMKAGLEPGLRSLGLSPAGFMLAPPPELSPRYEDGVVCLDADLVGPDVKFHHSKLNFKWAKGGEEVKWHQDITYWPHTNYSPLTAGLYLYDCGPEQGPLMAIPGSHNGELFSQYDDAGNWVGCLSDTDVKSVPVETAAELTGPAGSITIHNCRVVHGSRPNTADLGRPLLRVHPLKGHHSTASGARLSQTACHWA